MDLGESSWLSDFLGRLLAGYIPDHALSRLSPWERGLGAGRDVSPVVRAHRHLEVELRRSGLVYGTPKLPSRVAMGTRPDRAESLFFAVLASECFLALDVARIVGVPFDRDRCEVELTLLLAAAVGEIELAESMVRLVPRGARARHALDRLQERVAEALTERVALVVGDTAFDLPLHNGIVYGEARVLGRLAVDWFARRRFRPELARRLVAAADRERAALLQALLSLSLRHRALGEHERRAVRQELRKLQLERDLSRKVRAALDHPPSTAELARLIRTRPLRHFVLEQVYLASVADGLVDEAEAAFLAELVELFDASPEDMAVIEAHVADYFAQPEGVLDAFDVQAAGQRASEALVDRIAREISQHLDRVGNEMRETQELTQLLARAARGHRLTPDERARAREQLIDLAKVVPSLAIIAAPGGMILFAALLKALPFSILPSSWEAPDPPPRRIRHRLG